MIKRKNPERDWKEYNEHLVQRCEILLAVESMQGWQEELQEMNHRKNGRPFRYPHNLILFLGTLRVVFSLPYLQLEGFARRLGKLISIPASDYSTLSLRLLKLELDPALGFVSREGGGGGDHRRWDGDQGDQPRGLNAQEAEGLQQDPCGGDTPYGILYGLSETENHWSLGGFIYGRLEQMPADDIVIIRSQSGACKVLFNHGFIERAYVAGIKPKGETQVVEFKVPAQEFFDQPGHHTIELVSISSKHCQDPLVMSRCELEYQGPCIVPFSHCDLSTLYDPASGLLTIQGHYIGWRDPTLLLLSLPKDNTIPLEITEADPSWLKDKPTWFSHHLICRFSKRCQLEIPPNHFSDEAILRARFGGKEEFIISWSQLVIT